MNTEVCPSVLFIFCFPGKLYHSDKLPQFNFSVVLGVESFAADVS